MSARSYSVLTYAGRPVAIAEDRGRLEEYKAEKQYTAEQQQHMVTTEGVEVLE